MRDLITALAARGQYLPFDPILSRRGDDRRHRGGRSERPGRFRFGGVRDFILGVRFVDGRGRLLRMGWQGGKNAAGFDLPKFFVGSLGRFGVLTELTFKVFPAPSSTMTLKLAATLSVRRREFWSMPPAVVGKSMRSTFSPEISLFACG